MRKFIYVLLLILLIIVGTLIYLDKQERNSSYSTPEEALKNVLVPPWEVVEIIETRIYEEDNYAYVFFYSEADKPKDYYVVSEFKKGKYGWKYLKMFGGNIEEPNYQSYTYVGSSADGEQHGVAGSNTVSVKRGNKEAELIPLNKNNIKIWFIYKPTVEQEKSRLEFYGEDGKLLN